MGNIKNQTVATEELIATLSRYSEQIGQITDTITGIAKQTNLLALNAAIEAARAGEAGRGFAVVAEEVRKLAEHSNEEAERVVQLVRKIAESTAAAVASTQRSRVEAESGVDAVQKAGAALEKILTAVLGTVKDMQQIVSVTNDEVATSDKIVQLINSVATGIETMSTHAQHVAAATEEITAAVETVASSAQQTSAMASELRGVVERFKI
jgi:methyl-accepting chemotaxis protein